MTRIVYAALLGFTLTVAAGAAQAQFVDATTFPGQAPGANGPSNSVVGGGIATMFGGGDDRVIIYSTGEVGAAAQPRRSARLLGGSGDGPQVEYLAPSPTTLGRNARLVGGSDTEVVRLSPRQSR